MAQHLNQLSGTSSHLYRVTLAAIRQCSLSAARHFSSVRHPSILHSFSIRSTLCLAFGLMKKYSHQNEAEWELSLLSIFNVIVVNSGRVFVCHPDCDAFRKYVCHMCLKLALTQISQEWSRSAPGLSQARKNRILQ